MTEIQILARTYYGEAITPQHHFYMIISSAIKFFIEKTGKEVTLCGRRHGDIFMQLSLLGFEPRKGYKEICQGFITDSGDFLTREQAFEHAKQCGQISSVSIEKPSCELFSEMLW